DGIRGGHVTGVQTCALPISDEWRQGTPSAIVPHDIPARPTLCSGHGPAFRRLPPLVRRSRLVLVSGHTEVRTQEIPVPEPDLTRSEERRVGKECGSRSVPYN